jgi:hypothetical protein
MPGLIDALGCAFPATATDNVWRQVSCKVGADFGAYFEHVASLQQTNRKQKQYMQGRAHFAVRR